MRAYVRDPALHVVADIDAVPECGQDFCDRCGDCLHCFSGDDCWDGGEEPGWHAWVIYDADDVPQMRAAEASATP